MATVMAVRRGDRLLGLRDVLSCQAFVSLSFENPHSLSQHVRFGGKITQLGVLESKFFLNQCESALRQLKVEATLGQSRA